MLVLFEAAADIFQGLLVSCCAPARRIDWGPVGHNEGLWPSPQLHAPVRSWSRESPLPAFLPASAAWRLLGLGATGECELPEELQECWPSLPGKLCVCELVPSTSPNLLASTSPRTKGLCESKQWSLPGKDENFHYKKGVLGGKFQPTTGKCLIDEWNPPSPAVPLSLWWEWASGKAFHPKPQASEDAESMWI